ncbi:MAG TPA: alpha/beta hydrolase [Longimicrobiales bacterium]|nr:alpha/beta hydrolase [Longimicrobiales bacterium]
MRLAVGFRALEPRVYRSVGGRDLRLDLHLPAGPGGPWPTFVFFHGGGWIIGGRETVSLHLLPWMERGWATVNVEYRLAREARAPAAVWDARHAVRWVFEHAAEHGFDPQRVVLGGFSSGGHLALMAAVGGELPPDGSEAAAVAEQRQGDMRPPVAAAVSWFGISDVAALVEGERPRAFARHWLGARPDFLEIARALSPVGRIGPHTPPILSVHGDRDPVVPFSQSERLHEALDRTGVPNRLHVVAGGGHGDWDDDTWGRAYAAVFEFIEAREAAKDALV